MHVGEQDTTQPFSKVHTYTKRMSNIHFVERDGKYLMIDAGLPNDATGILKFMQKKSINPMDIDYLILTHTHPDHAGNAAFFQKEYGIKIIAGKDDLEIIQQGGYDKNLCPRGFQGAIIKRTIAAKRFTPFQPDILVEREIDLEQFGWEGYAEIYKSHTEGSLVVFLGKNVFVGDLIRGKPLHSHKPAFHIFMCDLTKNLNDIENVAQKDQYTTWFPGHGGQLQRGNVIKFINQKKKEL